jgi:hypothetical protein
MGIEKLEKLTNIWQWVIKTQTTKNKSCHFQLGWKNRIACTHMYFHHFVLSSVGIKDFSLKATLRRQTPLDTNVPSKQDEQASLKRVVAKLRKESIGMERTN